MTTPPAFPAFPAFTRFPSFPSGPHWSTASFGDATHPSPLELSALGDHLDVCRSLRGRLFAARCRAEVVRGFVASHLVTTVLGAAALSAVFWRML